MVGPACHAVPAADASVLAVAESTFDDEPVELVIGDGTLVHGLEVALYGMRAGQRQTLTLAPVQAFGERDPEAVGWLPREQGTQRAVALAKQTIAEVKAAIELP